MSKLISSWLRKRPVAGFAVLACAISWALTIPLALQAQGILSLRIPYAVHYLSAYGPMLAAIILTGVVDRQRGLTELTSRVTRWRVRPLWWLVALAPLLIAGMVSLLSRFLPAAPFGLADLGQVKGLPNLGLGALALWLLTFGLGEEIGWRGFVLPRLQRGHSALSATVILWGVWALWHVPLFFYSYSLSMVPMFLLSLLAGAINLTWLFNGSGGSVLITAVFHGLFDLTTACVICGTGVLAPALSALVMVWAVVVVLLYGPARLSNRRAVGHLELQMDARG